MILIRKEKWNINSVNDIFASGYYSSPEHVKLSPKTLQTSPNQRYSFSARIHNTPPPGRRNNLNPNSVVHRRNWIQKYKKRPNQLNIDETSVTGIRFS